MVERTLQTASIEAQMYELFLPGYERIYATAGKSKTFAPKCLKSEQGEAGTTHLVLEDLESKNFQRYNKCYEHSQHSYAVMEKLAELHAASAVHHERYGDCGETEFIADFAGKREVWKERSALLLKTFAEAVPKFGFNYEYEHYIEHLPTAEQFVDKLAELAQPVEGSFNVLLHGELSWNNIRFHYNERGEVVETLFVNFQHSRYGSPAYDLLFFIYAFGFYDYHPGTYRAAFTYQKALRDNLLLLKYKGRIPRLSDVQEMLKRARFYAFFIVLNHTPFLLSPTEAAGIDYEKATPELLLQLMTCKAYKSELRDMLPALYESVLVYSGINPYM